MTMISVSQERIRFAARHNDWLIHETDARTWWLFRFDSDLSGTPDGAIEFAADGHVSFALLDGARVTSVASFLSLLHVRKAAVAYV